MAKFDKISKGRSFELSKLKNKIGTIYMEEDLTWEFLMVYWAIAIMLSLTNILIDIILIAEYILRRFGFMKCKLITVLLVGLLVLVSGCSSDTSASYASDEIIVDSYEETGEATYDDLVDAYDEGWNEACDEVFINHYDLYYEDYQYNYYDYIDNYDGEPDIYETYPDTEFPYNESDLEEAHFQGRECALDTIFLDTNLLCFGEERYYRTDY